MTEQQLFLDCDARAIEVLGMHPSEFETIHGSKEFWRRIRDLPLMSDARLFMDEVQHLNPIILTGCPYGDWAPPQKIAWAEQHFPGVKMITCSSRDKRNHAKARDVLVDDRNQYRHLWLEMGGIWVTHTCAQSSLDALVAYRVM